MSNFRDQLKVEGINARGYGMIAKMVMQDRKLTIEAKSIYAYFCTYAGAGDTAFPSVEKIIGDLCISKPRFYKHMKPLIDLGYIEIEQKKNKGRFSHNIYTLKSNPVMLDNKISPCTQNIDTVENEEITDISPCTHFMHTENMHTQNSATNINNLYKSNNSLYNQSIIQSKENERENEIIDKNDFNNILINSNAYDVEEEFITAIPRAIRNLYYTDKPLRLNDILTAPQDIREDLKLLRWKHIDLAIRSFKKESEQQELRNPIAYLSTCIYNSIFDSEIKLNSELRFNGHI